MSRLVLNLILASALLLSACLESPPCAEEGTCDGDLPAFPENEPGCIGDDCPDPCSPETTVTGGLRVAMLDVRQGDAIAIIAPSGCAAVVDSGPTGSGETIKSYLRAQGIEWLSWAAVSHYHTDHLGGLDEVESGHDSVPIRTVYDRGAASVSSTAYSEYSKAFGDRRQQVHVGQTWTLCNEVCFRVVAVNANGVRTSNENARSVVLKLTYGRFSMLLGGDLSGGSPNIATKIRDEVGEVDVYKVHHHGSRSSSTAGFLTALRPTVSLISVGSSNSYGHPTLEALSRLSSAGSDVWRTESYAGPLGAIEVQVEGTSHFRVTQGELGAEYPVKGAEE